MNTGLGETRQDRCWLGLSESTYILEYIFIGGPILRCESNTGMSGVETRMSRVGRRASARKFWFDIELWRLDTTFSGAKPWIRWSQAEGMPSTGQFEVQK